MERLGIAANLFKKISSCGDPLFCLPRIPNMLTNCETTGRREDAKSGTLSANLSVRRKKTVGQKSVANADTDATQWVNCLVKVRDQRDEAAFVRLFRHFAPRVKAFLMRSGADEALAEECMQEVMVTIWHKAHLFDPSRASAATWIFTIARNRKIDALRKQRRPEPEELPWGPQAEPDQADALVLQQETDELGRAIAALPDKQRDLIERAYYGDLSHSELAEQTGLPLGTIKSRIRLALDRLRHAMR